jgi:hypothetical protein
MRLLADHLEVTSTAGEPGDQIDALRAALRSAVAQEKLLAVIATTARGGNWRASPWLPARLYPQK